MKWQSFLAFVSAVRVATGLKLIDESEDNGVICYTYLSAYLAAVDVETAGPVPVLPTTRGILPPYFTNRSTSAVPLSTFPADRESSTVLQDLDSTAALFTSSDFAIPTEFTDIVSPTRAISSDVSTTSSEAEVTSQTVILFIVPDTVNERRRLVKRDIPGGFVNGVNPVDICTDADIFQLADGQLLDNGNPVYYGGEPYKPFGSDGTPPDGATTRKFANVNGSLVFTSSLLPSTGFCQDDSGQVYITFGSRPPGCDPVLLQVYTVEQCLNGEIPGRDQSSSISGDATQFTVTASTDVGSSSVSLGPQEPTSNILAEPTDISRSSDSPTVATETRLTVTTNEAAIVTTDSSSTDLSSQSSLFTSPLSLTSSTISTIASQSAPLLPTSSTDSTVATISADVSSTSESSLEPLFSSVFSTDSAATGPLPEETTTSISTTTLSEESGTSTQLDTTTAAEETTTTIATTTTDCDSVMVLTTVALLNPTPVIGNSVSLDDAVEAVVLPFDVAGSGQSTVYVSENGVISVASNNGASTYTNGELPSLRLPPIAVCPYWDDLFLYRNRLNVIVYEVFDGQHGTQATFEWVVGRYNFPRDDTDRSLFHFTATFYKNFPQIFRFSYYTTADEGSGATTGVQNGVIEDYRQISFDRADSVLDGTSVFINLLTGGYETVPFDNTECGKGDPFDGSTIFAE
ncbi:hypothetical protein EDB82DRAFT_565991 [Fusarium venenatum]|uniref:uncharacterized protein n=1 Tax=Fusarium venenatum TaxID=56646 RepID=UPI001DF886DD|nr:hypothetical protein EDB82DRAFT_565991 [Fusarium venenatum]